MKEAEEVRVKKFDPDHNMNSLGRNTKFGVSEHALTEADECIEGWYEY